MRVVQEVLLGVVGSGECAAVHVQVSIFIFLVLLPVAEVLDLRRDHELAALLAVLPVAP